MEDIKKYYENTENALPHPIVKKFIEMNIAPGNAIDLGCGAGRDTVYLIKNGWNVLAIDKENTEEIISGRLNDKEINNFRFISGSFEKIEIEKNDLVVSNFSIPFCDKNNFNEFWDKIKYSIEKERIFCREFFWIKRFMGRYQKKYGIFIKRTSNEFI